MSEDRRERIRDLARESTLDACIDIAGSICNPGPGETDDVGETDLVTTTCYNCDPKSEQCNEIIIEGSVQCESIGYYSSVEECEANCSTTEGPTGETDDVGETDLVTTICYNCDPKSEQCNEIIIEGSKQCESIGYYSSLDLCNFECKQEPGSTNETEPTDFVPPILPCSELDAGCEFEFVGNDQNREYNLDGKCHNCIQDILIPEQMSYSTVGSGFRVGRVYAAKVLHGTLNQSAYIPGTTFLDTSDLIKLEYTEEQSGDTVKITPQAGWNNPGTGPFGNGAGKYIFNSLCSNLDKVVAVDFKLSLLGFDFSEPDYGITDIKVKLDMCPQPEYGAKCLPLAQQNNQLCTGTELPYVRLYVWHPGKTNYEDIGEDSDVNCLTAVSDIDAWIPMFSDDPQAGLWGFQQETHQIESVYGDNPPSKYRLSRECIDPKTGTIIVRAIICQNMNSPCGQMDVRFNKILACGTGDCQATQLGGLSCGQPPVQREVYDCTSPELLINDANNNHLLLRSAQMVNIGTPKVVSTWFSNFLTENNKNAPFVSSLSTDYQNTFPCFETLDLLEEQIAVNNTNWTFSETSSCCNVPQCQNCNDIPDPNNTEYIPGTVENNTDETGFTLTSSAGQFSSAPFSGSQSASSTTNYTLNNTLTEPGTLYFDWKFTRANGVSGFSYKPVGYYKNGIKFEFNTTQTENKQGVAAIKIKPGDNISFYIIRNNVCRRMNTGQILCDFSQTNSSTLEISNLVFDSDLKPGGGQCVAFITDLTYCNTNEGYDVNWPDPLPGGTELDIQNGINGLKIIETMRAESNNPDLIIRRGMWIWHHSTQKWVGNGCGLVLPDIDDEISEGIDLNVVHPYWKIRSKCNKWEPNLVDDVSECLHNSGVQSTCAKTPFRNEGGSYECTVPQDPAKYAGNSHLPGCQDINCCCQICSEPQFQNSIRQSLEYDYNCCDSVNSTAPNCGWDAFCSNWARRFCGNKLFCEDSYFYPPSGYGTQGNEQGDTLPPCGILDLENNVINTSKAFQFGTVNWESYLNFETFNAEDFIDLNGKITVLFFFYADLPINSLGQPTLDPAGYISSQQNAIGNAGAKPWEIPFNVYIDRLRAVPISATEVIPEPSPDSTNSNVFIVLPPFVPIDVGGGETDGSGNPGPGGGGPGPGP